VSSRCWTDELSAIPGHSKMAESLLLLRAWPSPVQHPAASSTAEDAAELRAWQGRFPIRSEWAFRRKKRPKPTPHLASRVWSTRQGQSAGGVGPLAQKGCGLAFQGHVVHTDTR